MFTEPKVLRAPQESNHTELQQMFEPLALTEPALIKRKAHSFAQKLSRVEGVQP